MSATPATLETVEPSIRSQLIMNRGSPDQRDITHDTRFEDLGLDSLDMFEIGLALEKQLSRVLPDELEDTETVGEMIEIANRDIAE